MLRKDRNCDLMEAISSTSPFYCSVLLQKCPAYTHLQTQSTILWQQQGSRLAILRAMKRDKGSETGHLRLTYCLREACLVVQTSWTGIEPHLPWRGGMKGTRDARNGQQVCILIKLQTLFFTQEHYLENRQRGE